MTKKDKEELVDSATVEWLRKGDIPSGNSPLFTHCFISLVEVGDPFLEPDVKF
jgi:hypothetical protein